LPRVPFGGFVTFAYNWQSAVNFSLSQDPRTVQAAYGIADFSAGINDNHDHYKVSLFLDNAFNKHYAVGLADSTSGFSAPGVTGVYGSTWTPARDSFLYYGLRVDLKF
jgi:iron complex outermembrane receptor protein